MELSSSKLKKLLIFQKETCLLFKGKYKRKKFLVLFLIKNQNPLNLNTFL